MSKVILEMTMSLDGFVAGPRVSKENAMGIGGERLHEWIFEGKSEGDDEVLKETADRTGAVIIGKTMFDVGLQFWQDTPFPVPTFVLTHVPREQLSMKSNTFTFITDGIESALRRAHKVSDVKDILVMGGANIAQQYLKAGLIDEMLIHIAPVLLGDGVRLLENIGRDRIELERTSLKGTASMTHLTFRTLK